MAGQDDAIMLFGYKTDQASVQTAIAANEKVAGALRQGNNAVIVSYADAQRAAKSLGLTVDEFATRMGITVEKQRQAAQATREQAGAYDQVAQSAQKAEAAIRRANASSDGGGIASGFGTLRSLSGAAGLVAGNSQAGSMAAALIGLTSTLGLAGAAIAGFGIVLNLLTSEQEKATEAAKKYASALAGASGQTTPDIDEQIKDLQSQLDMFSEARTGIESYGEQVDALRARFLDGELNSVEFALALQPLNHELHDMTGGVIGAKDGVGLFVTSSRDLGTILDENTKATVATSGSLAFLNTIRDSETVAANNAAEAAHKLAETQLEAAELAIEIDGLTKKQRDERIAQNDRDVSTLTRLIGAGGLNSEALRGYADQIEELNEETEKLTGISSTYADVLEREAAAKEALKDRNDQLIDLIDDEVAAREEAFEIQQKILEIEAERDKDILAVQAERDERLSLIAGEGAERREEIIADSNDRIAKIMRDSSRTIADTIAARDVVGNIQARRKQADDLADAAQASAKQLVAQDKNNAKLVASEDRAMSKRLDSINEGANKALRIEQGRLAQAEFLAASSAGAQLFIHQNMWNTAESMAINGAQRFLNGINGMFSGVFSGRGGSQFPTPPTLTGSPQGIALDRQIERGVTKVLKQVWSP